MNDELNFEKVTYEIVYGDVNNKEELYITTDGYDSLEECKKHFGLYTGSTEKVYGIKEIKHIETFTKVEDL